MTATDTIADADTPALEIARTDTRQARARAWLSEAVRPSTALIRLAGILGVGAGLCVIAHCYFLAALLHRLVIDKAGLWDVTNLIAGLLLAVVARAGLTMLQDQAGTAAAHHTERLLRDRFVRQMNARGPGWSQRFDAGALVTHATDHIGALEGYVARYCPQLIIAVAVPLAILAAAFSLNWVVGVIFLIAGPLAPFFMALIGMGAASASARQHEAMARLGGHFLDRLRGLTTLKLFGQAQEECDAIMGVAEGLRVRTMQVLRIAFLSSTVLEFFSMAAIAIIAVYVGMGLLGFMAFGPAHGITLFNALFMLLLAPEFFQPLRQLGALYHDRASAIGAAGQLMDILDLDGRPVPTPATQSPPAFSTAPAIQFRNVSLAFEGGRTVLHDVSFDVAPGTSLALMGPSGAGKTSILRLLMGFADLTGGEILIGGNPLSSYEQGTLRASIAWAGQNPHLFHGPLSANIVLGDPLPDASRIEDAARRAHVLGFAESLPAGLGTLIGERHFGLSGGEAQRLALARAFYRDAPLLLLDEPTASLDAENERLVLESLKDLMKGRTVILCTHSERAAKLCDRVLTITDGRIGALEEAS